MTDHLGSYLGICPQKANLASGQEFMYKIYHNIIYDRESSKKIKIRLNQGQNIGHGILDSHENDCVDLYLIAWEVTPIMPYTLTFKTTAKIPRGYV